MIRQQWFAPSVFAVATPAPVLSYITTRADPYAAEHAPIEPLHPDQN